MEFEPFTNKSRRLLNSDFVAENMRVGRIQSPIWPEMHQSFYYATGPNKVTEGNICEVIVYQGHPWGNALMFGHQGKGCGLSMYRGNKMWPLHNNVAMNGPSACTGLVDNPDRNVFQVRYKLP